MIPAQLHQWDVTPSEAIAIQNKLRPLIRLEPFNREVNLIGAADISYNRYSPTFYASFVVLEAPSLRKESRIPGFSRSSHEF